MSARESGRLADERIGGFAVSVLLRTCGSVDKRISGKDAMKKPDQSAKAVKNDLKHLSRILERALANTERSPARNKGIVANLSELVLRYTEETTQVARQVPRAVANGSARGMA